MGSMNRNDPVAFFRTAKKAIGVMREAVQQNSPLGAAKKDPEKVKAQQGFPSGEMWSDTMYKDRWSNFIWSTILSTVLCTALYFELKFRLALGLLGGGILILVTGALALLGLYTMYTYVKVIITGKSDIKL